MKQHERFSVVLHIFDALENRLAFMQLALLPFSCSTAELSLLSAGRTLTLSVTGRSARGRVFHTQLSVTEVTVETGTALNSNAFCVLEDT